MKTNIKFQGGTLTVFSLDRSQIIGELSDAEWVEEILDTGVNYVLSGIASEGTLDSILALLQAGVVTVAFDFSKDGMQFQGTAMMLKPVAAKAPASAIVSIETPESPKAIAGQSTTGSATVL